MRITQTEYDKYFTQWTMQKEKYEEELARISRADEEYYITASYLLELASRSYELFMGSEPEQKRQLLTLTLQNLEIKNGLIQSTWYKPFDMIVENRGVTPSANSHTWGHLLDSLLNLKIDFNFNISNINSLLSVTTI
ncbi:MAG TPA: hypothetical protein PLS49_00955 [Candidatus Woesebacteria bacterium]|nr:hypothetical protein [Candidatus Woesebacteria bacterium]